MTICARVETVVNTFCDFVTLRVFDVFISSQLAENDYH